MRAPAFRSSFLLLTFCILACATKPLPAKPDASATRTLGKTRVLGLEGRYGNQMWLGLRYAQAPKGAQRFRAPRAYQEQAAELKAHAFGAACPQYGHPFGVADAEVGAVIGDEDCLFLNVYAPKLTAEEAVTTKLPVMVWIHGGGNVVGHAAGYDGGRLAQEQKVVVVAVNYRLGPFGFFRNAALGAGSSPEDGSGNYGILDLVSALQWVQAHARSFGGDPGNVTIFGESAGARNVLTLLITPSARGLFHRAIAQSGSVRRQDPVEAEVFASAGGHKNSSSEVLARLLVADGKAKDVKAAREVLAKMAPAEVATYLRSQSNAALLGAYAKDADESFIAVPNTFAEGQVVPGAEPLAVLAQPESRVNVPVVLGTNRDENKTFLFPQERFVKRITPLYLRLRDAPRYNALATAMSASWKILGADAPAAAIAQSGGEVYVYRFDWDEEPTLLGANLSEMLGAGHGLEIPFVFGHFDLGRRANVIFSDDNLAGREELSGAMRAYWGAIARDGKPGDGSGKGSAWPAFGATQERLILDTKQGGGIRVARGVSTLESVLASVDADKRLRTPQERCAVLREVARFSRLVTPAAYTSLQGGACKDFPYDRDPY